jgi:tetratricopeptide (TPR) repeat protein
MKNDFDSEQFMEFFTTVMVGSKLIEGDPTDFAKCWHPDLIKCLKIAQEKEKIIELRSALEHKLAAIKLSEESRHAEAIIHCQEATDLFPEGSHFKFILALELIGTEDYGEASALLEKCVLANSDDWEAKYYLSKCYYMLNRLNRAIDLLEDCIKTHYEPVMSLEMGIYCATKGEVIGKELYGKLGRYDEQRTAEMASPYLEKALKSLQQCLKIGGEVDPRYFNKVCNMFDQLSPGRLSNMGIPLSLNRLHRVLSNVDEIPAPILDAEFESEKKVCSALVKSLHGKSSTRYQASVHLYETDDTDKVTNKMVDPVAFVKIIYPGLHQERPDVRVGYHKEPDH